MGLGSCAGLAGLGVESGSEILVHMFQMVEQGKYVLNWIMNRLNPGSQITDLS